MDVQNATVSGVIWGMYVAEKETTEISVQEQLIYIHFGVLQKTVGTS